MYWVFRLQQSPTFSQMAAGLKSLHSLLVVVGATTDLCEFLKLLVHSCCIFILVSSAAATGNRPRSMWILLARAASAPSYQMRRSATLPRPPSILPSVALGFLLRCVVRCIR